MEKNQDTEKGMVIFDIDGVVNSFSNHRFYYNFMRQSIKGLAKVRGHRALAVQLPEIRKIGGPNAMFAFAHQYCGDGQAFDKFSRDLIKNLNFDQINHDPSLCKFIKRLSNYGDLAVRSDGLTPIAAAAWMRVVENKSDAEIKKEILFSPKQSTTTRYIDDKPVLVSGIDDNGMRTKTDVQSWLDFAERNKCDLHQSVLLDDSRKNLKIAKELGMTTIHISKLDSLLKSSVFGCGLSDIIGDRMSDSLKRCKLTCGKDVDARTLFRVLLKQPNRIGKFNRFTYNSR